MPAVMAFNRFLHVESQSQGKWENPAFSRAPLRAAMMSDSSDRGRDMSRSSCCGAWPSPAW